MTDWEALERADDDKLVARITEAWRDVARDHPQTFRQLTMHPDVERIVIVYDQPETDHTTTDDDEHNPDDPTGEAAIHGNLAIRRLDLYSRFLAEIAARVDVLDVIRRQMMPAREAPPDTDDRYCKNCVKAQVLRNRKPGRHYCWWCEGVRQEYGSHPPEHIVKLRDETGDSTRVAKALADWNPKAKGRR